MSSLWKPSYMRRWAGVLALSGAASVAGGCAPAITTQQEVQLGRQYAAEINRELPVVQDAEINRYINRLGNTLARQADPRGIDYTFYVVNSDVVNAFAVPGGFIYINRGLIDRTDNLSELAGVLGHEIGHVVARHGVEQMQQMQNAQLGLALGSILLGQPSDLAQVGVQLGAGAYFSKNSRQAENEADGLAVRYVYDAGINPEGIVSFFGELLEQRQGNPSTIEQWFSTHPLTEDRISNTRRDVQRILSGPNSDLIVNTPAYRDFQNRVRTLPPAPQQRR